ncbi:glycoprotein Xg isoform X7 [Balaenoptera musculus]|uniref:Glycoprotein Xg isoform X7 n=1 Tax=Balaenoptera musculus TaxID=9771 RepID=A0A8B8WKT3_BALMU|nr:glycoprotein Xg isoform X7 [Balaenoptera musculus]
MEPWWGIFYLTFLCLLMHIRGQGDFDLADALDDPEPTKKPSSDIYPKPRPPYQPQPGNPDNSGNIYPRPKPMPRPQPGSSDNSGGGGGSYPPSHDGHGSTHGGDGYPSYGNPQGNRIAKIVSPIVCGLLVTLAGATASYFQYNRRKNCCRANVNFQSQGSRERYLGGVCSFWTLLPKENHRRTKLQTFLSKGGLHLQEGSYETEAYSGSIFLRIWATSKSQNLPLASLCWWMGGTEQPPGRGEPWCT